MRLGLIAVPAIAVIAFAPALSIAEVAAPATAENAPCVDVQIDTARAGNLDCLNRQLQERADREHQGAAPTAPIDARSPSNIVGTANQAAAEEKMGDAFGKSAIPQRPKLYYANPLAPYAGHP